MPVHLGDICGRFTRKECGKSGYVRESGPTWDALQAVWRLKVELRKDLKIERAAQSQITRERFKQLKAA